MYTQYIHALSLAFPSQFRNPLGGGGGGFAGVAIMSDDGDGKESGSSGMLGFRPERR